MEKLMTTFAKSKKDIIKEALEEADRAAVSEDKEASTQTSAAKKLHRTKVKRAPALPRQKSDQRLLEEFRESCADLEKLIVAEFDRVSALVSQKHARLVGKLKDDLLRYISNHRYLEQTLVAPSVEIDEVTFPWQKGNLNLSESFLQSCDNLEHLIMTRFDRLSKVLSQKHLANFEALREELLTYMNSHHRKLKPRHAMPLKPGKQTAIPEVTLPTKE